LRKNGIGEYNMEKENNDCDNNYDPELKNDRD